MWDDQFEELLRRFLPFLPPQEPLESDVKLRDLGLDSLGTVELLGNLENAYQVRFLDGALTMETFETPGVLWKTVENMLQRTAG
ncbi:MULTISPECIES: phosphopantetheine-binding protein [unclassified Streptomyces]|uniref:phosphopantetheine-binding protein n=1 Tax=unclassified Streptomyces TaxID=2593676 RepID=UPI002E2BD33B|nr:phosphopantetheine-binding protein [Streptomyces sp. NBC_01429]